MRIGLVIYGSLDTLSGGYLYDRELVALLRAQGDRVAIFSQSWSHYGRHLTHNLSAAFLQKLATAELDILLQDELNHPSLFWLNRRLRDRCATPIVSIVHHLRSSEPRPSWQNHVYRAVERRYLATVDGFIFNSATTRAAVAALLPTLPPHVVAYPAGNRFATQAARMDAAAIAARAQAPGPLRILFVGNVTPRKGLHTLLTALAMLPAAGWRLTVVGDTAVDPAYARRCRTLGDGANVVWHGRASDAALAAAFAAHHVLCVPSGYEGFGIVYLEGMAFGLPAVGTTAGAAPELIDDGRTGFLVPPESPAVLAGRLQQLAGDRARLTALGQAARRRYEQHPGWQASLAHVRQFLARMARPH